MANERFAVEDGLNLSITISFLTQSIRIKDLVQQLVSGHLLLPSVEGLMNSGEMRVDRVLSDDELSRLMSSTNQVSTVLAHLQTIVGNLQTIQAQEAAHCLIATGELDSAEALAIEVAQLSLDEDFLGEDEPDVGRELEDFRGD